MSSAYRLAMISRTLARLRSLQPSCALKGLSRTAALHTANSSKPYYVTTPIFYVNAEPHIGHLYSIMLTDLLKRWQQLLGRQSFMLTGTDEHGMKVQQVAQQKGLDPKEFCDVISQKFRDLVSVAQISNDRFIRTTDEDHKLAVTRLWTVLQDRGFIYKDKHKGWYCISDEAFYPETQTVASTDPKSGMPIRITKESGKPVEWASEENYYFVLSKMQDQLLKYYEEHPDFVIPNSRYTEVKEAVKEGLPDLSISRPSRRSTWGIPVPGDDTQTIYVWLDALTNYLTAAGYATAPSHDAFVTSIAAKNWADDAAAWPADVHVIGKDITRFHCIYWPAFLLAAGLPLPSHILVHSHWKMNGTKMSKSVGNVVDPYYQVNTLDADSVRYYLLCQNILEIDGDFSTESALKRRQVDVINKYGNLLGRVCSKKFSLEVSIKNMMSLSRKKRHSPAETRSAEFLEQERIFIETIDQLLGRVTTRMEHYDPTGALSEIWHLLYMGNKYCEDATPWKTERGNLSPALFAVAECLRVTSIILQAFLPQYAIGALDQLRVLQSRRTPEFAKYGVDNNYGKGSNDGKHLIKPII
ncbi:tRNA synthetases class I (M)-domain-containing protein [Limtongia smithiae]|uniref:tRNA synthetases class I (M)-domain-containing protein n=1 Tax=Limtongia smithiae TaxID=1125753 RepID=UPI0034CE31BA